MFIKITETPKNSVSKHRKTTGLTQEELALKVGITRQTVIAIEKGNYTPSVLLALKLAQVLKVPIGELFWL